MSQQANGNVSLSERASHFISTVNKQLAVYADEEMASAFALELRSFLDKEEVSQQEYVDIITICLKYFEIAALSSITAE